MLFGRVVALVFVVVAVPALAADPTFALTATSADFATYFPGYLANGYVSAQTGLRGTEATRGYMVGLMDYAADDFSRPAATPAWGEIDYSAGAGWLNRAPVDAAHFRDYRQTLDMKAATLTTAYAYVDHAKTTRIETISFVSEADPHLAATQITLTPDFDGDVTVSFAFRLWAEHAPRLPLGQLTGPEMEEALAARGLGFAPQAPATADRAAIWYPGHVAIAAATVDPTALTLQLDGRAKAGLRMAQAAAIRLPAGVTPVVNVVQTPYRLALTLKFHVAKGQTYRFSRVVALSRDGWGGDAAADRVLAEAARARGFDALRADHEAAWAKLWASDIRVTGDDRAQRAIHSDLYYLYASSTADTAWPIGACGLTPGYAGHAFWDSDTWVFPALLLLHPERAKSLVMFRARTLAAAQARAQAHGFAGAMYPWEADPENGSEQTPHFAAILGDHEIHVNADVALAQWQYWLATGDHDWLRTSGWPVIREVARFWASRATWNAARRAYDITHVTSVDESYSDVANDTFTNVSAQRALRVAGLAAAIVGKRPDPAWARIADRLYIPFDAPAQHHLHFDSATPHRTDSWGGGALAMLALPALDAPMTDTVRRNDFALSMRSIAAEQEPNSMGPPPVSMMAAASGDAAQATAWLNRDLDVALLKPPFNVRTETASNNTGTFVTASAGFVQNLLFGTTGLRLGDAGLRAAYPPFLPPGWAALTVTGVHLRGRVFDVGVTRDAGGVVRLSR